VSGGLGFYDFTNSLSQVSGPSSSYNFDVSAIGTGAHDFWVEYTDQCTETNDTAFFIVTVLDSLSVKLNDDTTLCRGVSIDLSAIAFGGVNTQYQYDWGTGLVVDSVLNVSSSSDQTYYISLSDGCSKYVPIDSIRVSLLDSLKANIIAPDSACFGELIDFQGKFTGGELSGYKFDWDNGQGNTSNYSLPITSNIEVVLIASDGCTVLNDTVRHQINVRDPLMLTMPDDRSICSGKSTDIEVIISGGISASRVLNWDQGLGIGNSKTVSPTSDIVYTVTVRDNCSDEISDEIEITVNPLPVVQFEVSRNPTCTGIDIEFENNSIYGLLSTFKWDFGNGASGLLENESYAYNLPGLYPVKLSVTNEFSCTDSLIKLDEIAVISHPVAKFISDPDVADYFKPSFDFVNQSSYSDNYVWSFGDGGASSAFEPSYKYTDTGSYSVSLVVSNDIGCLDTFIKIVKVEDVFVLHIPNAFSPNNDDINDTYGVESRGVIDYNMNVYTRWGEKVWSAQSSKDEWDGRYNGENVPVGFYIFLAWGVTTDGTKFEREGVISVIR
jgi:gliding motility-associated-like protein